MAPRGRPRKRLSRMDAATDAMTAFGFDGRLVQKTVKQLLKEYGGDDGWAFIEEYGYKELIEAILRDQDEDTTKQKGVSSQDERAEDPALQSILDPSGTLVDSTCNKAGNTVGETSCSELVAPTYIELCRNKQDICSTDKELNQVQPGSNSHVFAPPPTSSLCPVNYLKMCSASQVQSGSNSHVSTSPPTASLCPVNHLPPLVDHHPTTLSSSKGISSRDERAEDPVLESTTGPSGTLVDSTCKEAGYTLGETTCSKLVDIVGEPKHEELCSNKQDIGSTEVLCLPATEGDGHRCKDMREDQTSIQKGTANAFCSDGGNSGSQVLHAGSNSDVTIPPTSSPCPVNSVPPRADHLPTTLPCSKRVCLQPPRRRFPCYGWIESESEEDADDFIQLPPMRRVEFSE